MRSSLAVTGTVLAALIAQPAPAQTPAAGEADPGVRPTRLIDRGEVRVSRVEIFLKRGTPHGFKNVGTTPAAVFEIFVKQTKAARGPDGDALRALALTLAQELPK